MGEYEPRDSRNVTLKQQRAPGEPPRTGPREEETREPEQEHSGIEEADARTEAALREPATRQDDEPERERPSFDRND